MYLINKELEQITESDLQGLIDQEVLESKILDYKQALNISTNDEKKGFLANVSSFANASGGDLIFGIQEDRKTGLPQSIIGLDIDNVDRMILKLAQMIREGIEPNIPSASINIQPVKLNNSKNVIIIRIGKSWLAPHRICFKSWDRFYSRSTNGKYRLDIQELRSAFILSETIGEKIKSFREKRISDIYANELPLQFYNSPKIALHIIPLTAFNPGQYLDMKTISLYDIQPIGASNFDHRYNIDGLLTWSKFQHDQRSFSYVQLFRNGIVEAVNSEILWGGREVKEIHITLIEEKLIESIPQFIEIYPKYKIEPPVFIFLTFIDVRGYKMPERFIRRNNYPIERDIVQFPEIILEDFDFEPTQILRPLFDSIWNACGYEQSLNYDIDGEYKPRY